MTREQALSIVLDVASRWGENAEEQFSRRVDADDTDEQLEEIAHASSEVCEYEYMMDAVHEMRDIWKAIKMLMPEAKP